MNHWPFIIIAYAFAIGGTAVITAVSYGAMRRAEKRADSLSQRSER